MDKVMRCKMKLNHTETMNFGPHQEEPSVKCHFGAVYSPTGENAVFGKYTPTASFDLTIKNPEVIANLKVGAEYYVDFTEAVPSSNA